MISRNQARAAFGRVPDLKILTEFLYGIGQRWESTGNSSQLTGT